MASPTRASFLLLVLFLFPCEWAAAERYSNAQARKAYEIFADGEKEMKAALQKNDLRALRSAERTLLQARAHIPSDLSSLRYTVTEPQLVPGTGRWPRFEDLEVTKTPSYYPNRLISQIRHELSPRPDVVASIVPDGSGQRLTVRVTNSGQSDMEAFKVRVRGVGVSAAEKEIGSLRSGGDAEVTFSLPLSSAQISGLRLEFEEKYGFVPCPISF